MGGSTRMWSCICNSYIIVVEDVSKEIDVVT